ncbi:glycosyltransferase [Geomicrobium sp. JCM 19055]|uniref:glycosyltransferase n=1 Tax=Geomicrobium sp. JCM 19055 TaxID=1460649 RepID=UPI00187CA66C
MGRSTWTIKKIAFLLCVNDESYYIKCLRHISLLSVPKGYTIEVIAVRGAESMTEGYNKGMKKNRC